MTRLRIAKESLSDGAPERELGEDGAGLGDPPVEAQVLGRVDDVYPRAEDRGRPAPGGEGALVRRGVDPARQAAHDAEAPLAELGAQALRDALAVGRRPPASHDRDAGVPRRRNLLSDTGRPGGRGSRERSRG